MAFGHPMANAAHHRISLVTNSTSARVTHKFACLYNAGAYVGLCHDNTSEKESATRI